ncbi:ATP-binding protein [Sporosarcina sp. FSL K6-1522]|uniref:ATP-binding protein n=1 Tax=Sporosarcina sp. FSL K6-1522 TaxID=2921554 RepID=UPI00315AF04D
MQKDGIRQRYLTITITIMIILTLVTAGIYIYAKKSWDHFVTEQENLFEKAHEIDDLADATTGLFFRVRGYYAFQLDSELAIAYQEIETIKETIEKLKKRTLTDAEQDLVNEIETFLGQYEEEVLPQALAFVQANDYEGLRQLSLSGSNTTVNRLVDYSNSYNQQVNTGLHSVFEKTTQLLNGFFLLLFLLGLILLLFTIWMIWQVVYHFIRPIEQMRVAADNYQNGEEFIFKPIIRSDEIGALSDSFAKMIDTINVKEQKLVAQNDELLSQQEELFDKQAKMEHALSEARHSKFRLERYNGLNHHLSFTLDKQELADTVLDYFKELYAIDLGAFWLPQSGEYSLNNITDHMFEEFKEKQLHYVKLRLEKEPYYVLKREADYEKGIATSQTYVYDLMASVKDSEGKFHITLALSRVGRTFTKDDLHDIYGILNRVALAVDRIEQYELVNHERALNQNILDNVTEGIQFVSNSGNMQKYNQALFRLLDMPADSTECPTDKNGWIRCFMDKSNDDGQLQQFFETSLASQTTNVSQTSYTIQGDTLKVLNVYSVPVMMEGEKAGTVFVHRDITQEYEIDRMKTELVSTVSHELRTPLSSILGFTELLLSKEMDTKRQKRYQETIHKEAKRLTNLINDFLDLQRMESGNQSYDIQEVNLSEITIRAIENFPKNDAHAITLVDNTSTPILYADQDRILQVFTNILSNAIKFSPEGGAVTVSLSTEGDQAIVAIKDEGIGIPAEQVDHLFEKFHRLDNSYSRKIGGTGLGLAICREIIEKHNGAIWIESEEYKGTTVFFSLPIKKVINTEMLSANKPAVVVVEDDDSIVLLLAEELRMKGFSFISHSEVQAAFDYTKDQQPDCIVIDLMLRDDQTGWDLIKLLKEETSTQHIPIIISSALEKQEELIAEYQIDHYMTKPYPLHQLSETIAIALEKREGVILYPHSSQGGL